MEHETETSDVINQCSCFNNSAMLPTTTSTTTQPPYPDGFFEPIKKFDWSQQGQGRGYENEGQGRGYENEAEDEDSEDNEEYRVFSEEEREIDGNQIVRHQLIPYAWHTHRTTNTLNQSAHKMNTKIHTKTTTKPEFYEEDSIGI